MAVAGQCFCLQKSCCLCFPPTLVDLGPESAEQCFCFQQNCELCRRGGVQRERQSKRKRSAPQLLPVGGFREQPGSKQSEPRGPCFCFQQSCADCGISQILSDNLAVESAGEVSFDSRGRVKRPVRQDVDDINESGTSAIKRNYAGCVASLVGTTRPSWSAMEEIGRSRSETWHFWEIYSGCGNLTAAVKDQGGTCGPSVDIGQLAELPLDWQLMQESKVQWVHFGFPCTFWINLGRATAKRTPQDWKRLQAEALEHANFSVHGLRHQHSCDRKGSLEQPKGSGSLRLDAVSELRDLGFRLHTYHSCAWGLKDEYGRALLKPGAIGSTSDLTCMQKYCVCKKVMGANGRRTRRHGRVQGSVQTGPDKGKKRSQVAGRYTKSWCGACFVSSSAHACLRFALSAGASSWDTEPWVNQRSKCKSTHGRSCKYRILNTFFQFLPSRGC